MTRETFYSYKYPTTNDAVKARDERAKELRMHGKRVTKSSLRNQIIKPDFFHSYLTNCYYIDY